MTDVLATIDAATGGLCACGCERPLDPDGASGWWATETCQSIWQAGGRLHPGVVAVAPPNSQVFLIDEEHLAQYARIAFHRARQVMDDFARQVVTIMQQMGPAIQQLAAPLNQVRCAVHQVDAVPDDPMERALYLRRHRNTGPVPQQRAPRRIDPRRSR